MPHIISQASRMAHHGCRSGLPADNNIPSSVTRVIVKTPGHQEDFTVAHDTSVRQFKEKLSAHFKCQMDQIVLVFMGRLLKDHDTLSQRGILDGHTIHLVIKSKNGSRSRILHSHNLSTNEPCLQDRNTNGNSGVCQPAGVSHISGKAAHFVESERPKEHIQDTEVGGTELEVQKLENPIVQQLLSNVDLMRQFISDHPDMQQLVQQNPEVSNILENSEILCQTLELARNLAIIQEIMQTQQPAQNLEQPRNPQSCLGLETISGGDNVLGHSYADFSDQVLNSLHDLFGSNIFKALLEGQIPEVDSSTPSPPPSQEQWNQLSQLPTTRVIYSSSRSGLTSIISPNTTPNRANHTCRVNTAALSTKSQSQTCAIQQPAGVPALPSIELSQQSQAKDKHATTSSDSFDQSSEEDLHPLDEQSSSQITGSMMQLLLNNPNLAAQIMSFMSMSQLSEQWRQPLLTFLQQTQLSDMLLSLTNPKASQALLQIEQSLQILATEAPNLLPCVAPYLWGLAWLPAPCCSYSDAVPCTGNMSDMTESKMSECCHKCGTVPQRTQSLADAPSQLLQVPEIRYSKQMESLQAMGFGNYQANLQALIATEGDTSAAIHKLKRSQGF
ncbi:ubiquilin-like protein [Talpa occidentalis]|uniref:ubiquilin-like protein n=1 Tax=Talpa occidentalis TaxID=50954 RepID=UPI0018906255|nr:ubiquilin-like protein [Talpa occidentalis]